eukprot:GHVR01105533.1.p1 GENE.GHVR01105533.1~~GHVR01105533.1.p1  ORF type:complete len:173 (+),score=26.13 GHVR01105533.1:488-1006(+)
MQNSNVQPVNVPDEDECVRLCQSYFAKNKDAAVEFLNTQFNQQRKIKGYSPSGVPVYEDDGGSKPSLPTDYIQNPCIIINHLINLMSQIIHTLPPLSAALGNIIPPVPTQPLDINDNNTNYLNQGVNVNDPQNKLQCQSPKMNDGCCKCANCVICMNERVNGIRIDPNVQEG